MKSLWFLLMFLVPAAPCLAQLPGLPAPAPYENTPTVRPANPPAAASSPAAPLRGSLFKQGTPAAYVTAGADAPPQAAPASFISVPPPRPHKYKKNDVLTVIIREDSDSSTSGKGDSKKTQDFDLALQQFLQLALSQSGVPTVGVVGAPSKLPEVKFKYNNNTQSNADQDRTDTFSARISATITDVKPNGTMVIEAIKHITVDKEEQTFTLSGVCRAEDIAADNTVLSTQLANLNLSKQTTGSVHDGTKRGWLNGFLDKFNPF